jgi:hypothetical protein
MPESGARGEEGTTSGGGAARPVLADPRPGLVRMPDPELDGEWDGTPMVVSGAIRFKKNEVNWCGKETR